VPSRDLYALGQAIIVSLGWLPVVWVLGGNQIIDWIVKETVDNHELGVLAYVVLNLLVAAAAGFVAGTLVDRLGEWVAAHPDTRRADISA
jgi:hypothetical protein